MYTIVSSVGSVGVPLSFTLTSPFNGAVTTVMALVDGPSPPKLSLTNTSTVTELSSIASTASSTATGASFSLLILKVTIAVSQSPSTSHIWYSKLSSPK